MACVIAANERRNESGSFFSLPPKEIVDAICSKPVVTAEDLVRAFADLDHDRSRITRELRNVIERHANRIGDRLVLMKDQSRQKLLHLFFGDDHFVMVGPKLFAQMRRAGSSSLRYSASLKPTVNVSTGRDICSDISATFADESTPPDRNTPNGTSDIIRLRIESRSKRRISARCSSSVRPGSFVRRKRVPVLLDVERAVAR